MHEIVFALLIGSLAVPALELRGPVAPVADERPSVVELAKRGKRPPRKGKATPATPKPDEPQPPGDPAPPAAVEPPPPSKLPASLPPAPALPKKGKTVGVVPLKVIDVPADFVQAIEQALLREVDETAGMRSVSPADVTSELAKAGLDLAVCEGELECMGKLVRYARCHLMLESSVAAIGGSLSVSLRLVDTQSGTVVGRVAEQISEDATERSQELHRLAVQLLAPETYVGALTIQAAQEGAEVYLDDKLVGTTPLRKPLTGLAAGPHILRVSKTGFADLNQFVDVVFNRNATISVDLQSATISGLIVEQVSTTGFGTVVVLSNEEAVEVRVDGEPVGMTPVAPIEKVPAGARRLSFRKDGFAALVEEVEVVAGKRTELAVLLRGEVMSLAASRTVEVETALPSFADLVGVVEPPPVAGPPPAWTPGGKFWVGVSLGGAAALAFVGTGVAGAKIVGLTDERDTWIEKDDDGNLVARPGACADFEGNRCTKGELARIDRDGKSWSFIWLGSMVAGAALGLTGAGLVLWDVFADRPAAVAEPTATVMGVDLAPLPGGGALVLSGTF